MISHTRFYFALILALCCCGFVICKQDTIVERYFSQILDHRVNRLDSSTFQQRFFVNEGLFDATQKQHTVFFQLSQRPLDAGMVQLNSSFLFQNIASQYSSSLIVSLEHRFFGKSQPFGQQLTTEQLSSFLNSRQVIQDLIYFTQHINSLYNLRVNQTEPTWILYGNNFGGFLAAMFRQQFPKYSKMCYVSNANMLFDGVNGFPQVDQIVIKNLLKDENLVNKLRNTTKYLEVKLDQLQQDPIALENFYSQFSLTSLQSTDDFLFITSEMIVQGLSRIPNWNQTIATLFQNATFDNSELLIQRYAILINSLFQRTGGSSFTNYFARYLQLNQMFSNSTMEDEYWRPYEFLQCNEYGYFVPFATGSFRSSRINRDYYVTRCNRAFGARTALERQYLDTTILLDYYGLGTNQTTAQYFGANCIFTSAQYDGNNAYTIQSKNGMMNPSVKVFSFSNQFHLADTQLGNTNHNFAKQQNELMTTIKTWIGASNIYCVECNALSEHFWYILVGCFAAAFTFFLFTTIAMTISYIFQSLRYRDVMTAYKRLDRGE